MRPKRAVILILGPNHNFCPDLHTLPPFLPLSPSFRHFLSYKRTRATPRSKDPCLPDDPMLPLSDALESPANGPAGRADIATLQKLQERTLRNRTRLQDRFYQLPLYGKARDKCAGPKARWTMDGCPSDHPLIQMILALRNDEQELEGIPAEELETKERLKIRLSIKAKMADLLLALQKENERIYDEVMEVIQHDHSITQHEDKMAHLAGKSDDDAADADLIAKAERLGIPLNGDSQ